MKNIIFMLAFLLMSGFSFANQKEISKTIENESMILKNNDLINGFFKNSYVFQRCKITHNVRDEEGNIM
jgi:hypothetical protein